jgi:hypothetical protein
MILCVAFPYIYAQMFMDDACEQSEVVMGKSGMAAQNFISMRPRTCFAQDFMRSPWMLLASGTATLVAILCQLLLQFAGESGARLQLGLRSLQELVAPGIWKLKYQVIPYIYSMVAMSNLVLVLEMLLAGVYLNDLATALVGCLGANIVFRLAVILLSPGDAGVAVVDSLLEGWTEQADAQSLFTQLMHKDSSVFAITAAQCGALRGLDVHSPLNQLFTDAERGEYTVLSDSDSGHGSRKVYWASMPLRAVYFSEDDLLHPVEPYDERADFPKQ